MNAVDRVQSTGVTLTLLRTHCVHTSMNVRKMKSISYIYIILGMLFIYLQLTENDVIGNK